MLPKKSASIWIIFLLWQANICPGQQTPAYIEEDRDLQRLFDRALQEQCSGNTEMAFSLYREILNAQNPEAVFPFYYSGLPLTSLAKTLDDFGQGKLAKTERYLPEVFAGSRLLLTYQDMERLSGIYREAGIAGVGKDLSLSIAAGVYSGVSERARQGMVGTFPTKLTPLLEDDYEQTRLLYYGLFGAGDISDLDRFMSRNPSFAARGWIVLGDMYFARGETQRALGTWQRLLSWDCPLAEHDQYRLAGRIALASRQVGDHLVYYNILKQYGTEAEHVEVMGRKLPLGKWLAQISALPEHERPVWNNWQGNSGHSGSVPAVDLREKLSPLPPYSCDCSGCLPQPVYCQGRLFYSFPSNPLCIELKSGKLIWSKKYPKIPKASRLFLSTGLVHQNRFYFFSATSELPEIFEQEKLYNDIGNTLYCVNAATGNTVWQWPATKEEGIVFNTVPVAVGNRLFVGGTTLVGQINAELFCFALEDPSKPDSRPGQLLWRRFLGSKTSGHEQATIHYVSGVACGYGMVYCCTSLGIVAAVDAESGDVRWLYQEPEPKYRLCGGYQAWSNMPPVVRHGRVYAAPNDAGCLYVLSAMTGALQRRYPDSRDNDEWDRLIGVGEDGTIFLAGPQKVTALAASGAKEILWSGDYRVRGPGCLSRRWIYLPVQEGVMQIDVKTGNAEKVIATGLTERAGMWPSSVPVVPETPVSVLPIVTETGERYTVVTGIREPQKNNETIDARAYINIYK